MRRRTWRVAAAVLAAALTLGTVPPATASPAAATTAEPAADAVADRPGEFDETVLWDAAEGGEHESYHVQGLAVTPADTVLAFTEGRHDVCDAGPRDIVLRRSTDRGDSWEPSRIVVPSVD